MRVGELLDLFRRESLLCLYDATTLRARGADSTALPGQSSVDPRKLQASWLCLGLDIWV